MWRRDGRARISALLVLLIFLAGVAVTAGFYHITGATAGPQQAYQNAVSTAQPASASIPAGLGPETIADIVDKTGPAVVRIDTVTETQGSSPFNDPFFRQFFGDQFNTGPQVQRALGSGFIISSDGYILTNQHVVEGARQVKVTIVGFDKPLNAQVIGADSSLDLAVLKVDAGKPLPYLALGDTNKVRVGDWAIAIGNPDGLDHTVTVGVISAKGRPIDVQNRHYENLLQTDAAINPGNSGGPLLNLKGEVIGINTAVNADAQGIGFAIPSSTVQPVLKDLMTKGKISRPWLGVALQQVTPDVADILGLQGQEGAVVVQVVSGSPAAKAGLQKYDVILQVDGQAVKDASDLVNKIQSMKIGQQVQLQVFRRGQTLNISVVLGEKPAQ
ncbi:trypsin-like serine proteases, typically periplasmic, contain C-terminal PDZ domain [Moorella thermoacetica Y72]|uniref:Trypsin-like serine proteases, typically periplasmic, contain C-terminal PDZ domain n=2 Tax=Neomoorella thermoacetica TaxID=1525 RepID=A0A0S6UG56_NEOTH|nr:trypsin-like peptidase domain-containing protein [Moorella thermoacetica]OIQ09865.1 putative serine protease HhoB precursor [Moorella thermoacetica]GAF26444.1 trypsin-like serine proteases, typically periplasmic, contain C-terminal PDZ domain [Moorella thermoacetica Y72]